MPSPAVELDSLTKVYRAGLGGRRVTALSAVDLKVERGEVFGLLGPNGAGKTTAVKVLLGLTFPTAGAARLLGIPSTDRESRRRVGYLPEGHRFPGYLTARQTLSVFGRMSGVGPADLKRRIPVLLERLRIAEWADVRVKRFSKGMTQRLGLASALVHEPKVLLLDEPTDGVDPVGRREIRDLLREEAAKGTTVLLNSHLLSEIELTCDRVAVLRKGTVAAEGRIADLTRTSPRYRLCLAATPVEPALLESFRSTGALVDSVNGHFELTVRDVTHLNALVDRVRAAGGEIEELSPLRSSLEDVFVELVKSPGEREEKPS